MVSKNLTTNMILVYMIKDIYNFLSKFVLYVLFFIFLFCPSVPFWPC